ncbi:MAG: nodulation protein NfeD [Gemmatimonadetes bacterium]|nr:nodulation protein NfeD [Gemmatimonadota bacterium]
MRASRAVVALVLSLPLLAGAAPVPQSQGAGATVYRVPVTGEIELGLAPFVERSLREAERAGAAAVILDMDTPGGRVDAAERIADVVSDAAVPVYAYVNRRAFSAGALISLATKEIFMRPGAVMGAATPVVGTGEKAPEKIVSAMRSEMRALAEARGLDPRIAEAMVDEDIEIPGVVEKGKLLTLTAEEAARLGYAREVEDWDVLMQTLSVPGAQVVTVEVNWAEGVVRFLSSHLVAPFLLTLGFLGLLIELKTPGFGLAGAAGLLSLALYFGSHLIIGLAGWEELILFGVGIILLVVEIFLVPGFGLFGVGGIAALLVSIFLSLIGRLPTAADLTTAALVLSTTVLVALVTAWALLRTLPRSARLARTGILLDTEESRETGYLSAPPRRDLVGARGVALTDLRPSGTGLFGDERIDVVSESEWINAGTAIRVVSSEGYRHVVRPTKEQA